jgi:8-oxo-dGTP pyrophosphatase MutT (NUDIX family)
MGAEKRYITQLQSFHPCCGQEKKDQEVILSLCCDDQDILTRQNVVCHLTSSGLILNEKRDKMLMVHHNIYRTWTWTGGHADGDGDLENVALREAREETGVIGVNMIYPGIASLDIIPVYGHIKRGEYVSAHLHLNASYLLQAFEEDKLTVREDENSGVEWTPLAEVAGRSKEPELIRIFRKMLARIDIPLPV